MTSQFVLGNTSLQYTSSRLRTRYSLYVAFQQPVRFASISQDIQYDANGVPSNVVNYDRLINSQAPYAPQANLGPNRIGFVGEPLFFDGSRSSQRGNQPAIGHNWSFTGAPQLTYYHSAFGANQQVSAVWNTPGTYTVTLQTFDRYGQNAHDGVRQVTIYADRTQTPAGILSLNNLAGSIANGGWSTSLTVSKATAGVLDPARLPLGTFQPVVILLETEYEAQPGQWQRQTLGQYGAPVPGQFYDDPRVLFNGYVASGSSFSNSQEAVISLQLQTPELVLQQLQIHNIGFYNGYIDSTRKSDGRPRSIDAYSYNGVGQLINDLTTEDIYRALLSGVLEYNGRIIYPGGDTQPSLRISNAFSNFGQYHDLCLWHPLIPTAAGNAIQVPKAGQAPTGSLSYSAGQAATFALTYSGLTCNEGSIYDALTSLASNESADVWCDRTGMLCIGPQPRLWGFEDMSMPTVYGQVYLGEILNYVDELGSNPASEYSAAYLLFLYGPNPLPQPQELPGGPLRDLSQLVGPPVVCHFSDAPIYDSGTLAGLPGGGSELLPGERDNWPQDLAVHPLALTVYSNYTQRTGLVKLIATLVNSSNTWSAWYPQNYFDKTGIMATTAVPPGAWDVVQDLVLADAVANPAIKGGSSTGTSRSWQWLWELARRRFYAANAPFTAHVSLPLAPYLRLRDLVYLSNTDTANGPTFQQQPFTISSLSYSFDVGAGSWTTEVDLDPATAFSLSGPMPAPPFNPPAF